MLTDCVACGNLVMILNENGLAHCQICNHYQFRNPIGTKKYDQEYKEKYDGYEHSVLGIKINNYRWGIVKRFVYAQGSRILDWGCGNGSFIRHSPNGFTVAGYDINPYTGYAGQERLLGNHWEGVTLFDVIEHLERPHEFLKSVSAGYIFVITPDTAGIKENIEDWKHYRPDEHQHYFSVSSLTRLLERSGYATVYLDRGEAVLRDITAPLNLVTVVGKKI